jgi:hypothetical protein
MDLHQDSEDKAMRKTGIKKPKGKRSANPEGSPHQKEMDHLAEELVEVADEIEHVAGEDSTLEDIEGAKTLASDVLEKYTRFQKELDQRDKMELERSAGPVVEQIKKGLTLLKEAPE